MRPLARAVAAAVFTLTTSTIGQAQGRTDVVTLANGDRITGEIVRLTRGRLEFKTDDAGTLYLEWDKLVSLVARRVVEVVTTDGRRFVGTLGQTANRALAVIVSPRESVSLQMVEVTLMTPIGQSFWRKLDGELDLGFDYTKSSGVATLNLNSETVYNRPAFEARMAASLTLTQKEDDEGRDDRGSLELSYLRYRWQRWFVAATTRFETNESLGLSLRSQVGVITGPRLINTNRGQLAIGGGLAFNDERGVDVESTRNLEAILMLRGSYYTYDRPRTNLDLGVQYYPSLSDVGRQRLQLDAGARREVFKDFFIALTVFHTFDSRPPNPTADRNDVGIVTSIGWSY